MTQSNDPNITSAPATDALDTWIEATVKQLNNDPRARPWQKTFGDFVHHEGGKELITIADNKDGQLCPHEGNVAA